MNILKMLPFLSSEDIEKLLEQTELGDDSPFTLSQILPFASSKTVNRLMLEEFKKTGRLKSSYYAFASSKGLHNIVLYHIENDFGELSSAILPFLNQEDVKLLFDYTLKKKGSNAAKEDDGEKETTVSMGKRHFHFSFSRGDDDDDEDEEQEDEDNDDDDEHEEEDEHEDEDDDEN